MTKPKFTFLGTLRGWCDKVVPVDIQGRYLKPEGVHVLRVPYLWPLNYQRKMQPVSRLGKVLALKGNWKCRNVLLAAP